MIYANLSKTGAAWLTDGKILKRVQAGALVTVEKPDHELINHINQIKVFNKVFDTEAAALEYLSAETETRAKVKRLHRDANRAARAEFLNSLDEFWQDVNQRVGFDVITPFVNRYPGLSFVAYDANFVWCKTTKTAYLLDGFKGRAYLPKTCKNIVRFGQKLD